MMLQEHLQTLLIVLADISAIKYRCAYAVGPNLELQHYNTSLGVKFCLGQINPVELRTYLRGT